MAISRRSPGSRVVVAALTACALGLGLSGLSAQDGPSTEYEHVRVEPPVKQDEATTQQVPSQVNEVQAAVPVAENTTSATEGSASANKGSLVGGYEILQVYYRYIPEDNFMRLTEFFDGEENPGVRKLVRSTQEQRSGFYFVLRIKPGWKSLPEGSVLRVHYVQKDQIRPVVYDFELNEEVRSWKGEIFFGLTGKQWLAQGGEPIAWKLELLNPEGNVLAVKESFLWKEMPAR